VNRVGENRLLSALPPKDRERILSRTKKESFSLRETIFKPGESIRKVLFPLSGVMSMVITLEDRMQVEVGTVGNEGYVGTPVFLNAAKSPTFVFCQVPGEALTIETEAFRREVARSDALRGLLERYTQAVINQISQSVACNHLHLIDQRACRWLLMCHDRTGKDQIQLTQDFLAQMLGVRRSSVTVVMGMLQKAGLIEYHRGMIKILDRKGLEEAACECYGVVRKELERLVG
jgi:CRP-like cAMP-binding protein